MGQVVGSKDVNISLQMPQSDYVTVITQMRTQLAVTWTRKCPVLRRLIPDETKGITAFRRDVRWFDIVLKLNETGKPQLVVTLRIRSDNLYLYGYQLNNVAPWFELRTAQDPWCIAQGSQALGYDHNYNSIERVAGVPLTSIKLGREELVNAAKALAGQGVAERAQALIKMIFMFAEAMRFVEVLGYVKKGFILGPTPKIEEWILGQVRSWGTLSYAVLYYDQFPGTKWTVQTIVTETGTVNLYSVEDVLKYVALLLRDPRTIPPTTTITITIKANL